MAVREDHVQSAVSFLNEQQVASAPLNKKVEFLESKGLTSEEIDEALARARSDTQSQSASATSVTPVQIPATPYPSYLVQQSPPVPQRDWKDYFVMATVSVGVAYGLYECARRYVLPMIMPPTPAALDADKAALEAEFQRTEQLVEQLQRDTAEIRAQEDQRSVEFEKLLVEGRGLFKDIKDQADERRQESKLALSTVETLRDLVPRALEKHGSTQAAAISELQNELKSLKQLVSRSKQGSGLSIPPASAVPTSIAPFPRATPTEASTASKSAPGGNGSDLVASASSAVTTENPTSPSGNAVAAADPVAIVNTTKPDDNTAGAPFIPNPQLSQGIPVWQRAAANK